MIRDRLLRADAASVLGAGLVAAGFVMMGLGWWGASRTIFVPAQLGYLLSGGVAGLCTLVTGLVLLVVQRLRVSTARRSRALTAVTREALEIQARLAERTDVVKGDGA